MLQRFPRVTAGIPVYRGQKHILKAIASVRADAYADWETSSSTIVRKLQEADRLLGEGKPLVQMCIHLEDTEKT